MVCVLVLCERLSVRRGFLRTASGTQAASLVSFRGNTGSPRPPVILLIFLWPVVTLVDVKHVGKMSTHTSSSCQSPWINLTASMWGHWSPYSGSCVWLGSILDSASQNTHLIAIRPFLCSFSSSHCLAEKLIFSKLWLSCNRKGDSRPGFPSFHLSRSSRTSYKEGFLHHCHNSRSGWDSGQDGSSVSSNCSCSLPSAFAWT